MVRTNKGRQKIEMKKMTNESNLQVTFSKRRFSLFKKASELCTLCGVEILMIVFSPGGKVFSFGHPDVNHLIDRFFNLNGSVILHQHNNNIQLAESRPQIQRLNDILTQMVAKQEDAKRKRMALEKVRVNREKEGKWFEKNVKDLNMDETDSLINALQDMKMKLVSEMSQYRQVTVSHNYVGESSGSIGGRLNVDLGIDLSDQRRNTFNYHPNMLFPYQRPMFGYNNDGVIVPRTDMNYMSSYNNFNQS